MAFPARREERVRVIKAPPTPPLINELYPPDICEACRAISLDGLLATHESSPEKELLCTQYFRKKNAVDRCPLCRIIFASITGGGKIEGFVEVQMSADDRVQNGNRYEYKAREIREVLIRKCWGTNASSVAAGGRFRVYADEGIATTLHVRYYTCEPYACQILLQHNSS